MSDETPPGDAAGVHSAAVWAAAQRLYYDGPNVQRGVDFARLSPPTREQFFDLAVAAIGAYERAMEAIGALRTASGRLLSAEEIEALADEASRGYNVETLSPRPVRQGEDQDG